eukprot:11573901-Ditylum_brightwellii.AAC.1
MLELLHQILTGDSSHTQGIHCLDILIIILVKWNIGGKHSAHVDILQRFSFALTYPIHTADAGVEACFLFVGWFAFFEGNGFGAALYGHDT